MLVPGKLYHLPEKVREMGGRGPGERPVLYYPYKIQTQDIDGPHQYIKDIFVAMFIGEYKQGKYTMGKGLYQIFLYDTRLVCFERQINENPEQYLTPCLP